MPRLHLMVQFDGGARGNPGPGGAAAVVWGRSKAPPTPKPKPKPKPKAQGAAQGAAAQAAAAQGAGGGQAQGQEAQEGQGQEVLVPLPMWQGYQYMPPPVTNNVAEYTGLIIGLRAVAQLCQPSGIAVDLLVGGDSQLVVSQMTGTWQVKSSSLQELHRQAQELVEALPEGSQIRWEWTPRGSNATADHLVNVALDSQESLVTAPNPLAAFVW